ncbi:MAG: hypothetical protein V4492_02565 [Chlamydiota bacterium]
MSHLSTVERGQTSIAPTNTPPSRELLLSAAQALFAKHIKSSIPITLTQPTVIDPEQVTSVSPSSPEVETIDRLHERVHALEGHVSRLTDENKQLRDQLLRNTSTEETLQENNEGLQKELQSAREQLEMSASAQSALQQEYNHLASRQQSIEQELEQTKQQLTAAIASSSNTHQLIQELQSKSQDLGRLQEQLSDLSGQKNNLERQYARQKETLEATQIRLAQAEEEYERLLRDTQEQRIEFERSMVRFLPVSPILPPGGKGPSITFLRNIPSPPISSPDAHKHVQELQQQLLLLQNALNLTRDQLEKQLQEAHIHTTASSSVPPPPPLDLNSTSSTSSSTDPIPKPPILFDSFELMKTGRRVRRKRFKSWERTYLWDEKMGPKGGRDPLAGLETFVRNWVRSETPSQDIDTKRRLFTWANNYLERVHQDLKGAISFCKILETCAPEISAREAKRLLSDAFVNPIRTAPGLSDGDEDDWSEDDLPPPSTTLRVEEGDHMDSMIDSFNADDYVNDSLLLETDESIFNVSATALPVEIKMITKETLQFRFEMKIQQLDRTKVFVEDVLRRADLGKFGALGRANSED